MKDIKTIAKVLEFLVFKIPLLGSPTRKDKQLELWRSQSKETFQRKEKRNKKAFIVSDGNTSRNSSLDFKNDGCPKKLFLKSFKYSHANICVAATLLKRDYSASVFL